MHLVVIGLNYKTTPIELREKLSISESQIPGLLSALTSRDTISECLILSTCNRTEIYAYAASKADDELLIDTVAQFCGVSSEDLANHLYIHPGHKAVAHLFRVVSSLDSMVLGEAQILGQVKDAYSTASSEGSTGPVLNNLFQQAITVGKRARTETEIGRGAFSVGSVAIQLAKSIFDDLKGHTVLIVGAGKMGELTLTHLISSGANDVLVANRTHEKAVDLACRFNGKAVKWDSLPSALESADVVIASTGAKDPVITSKMVGGVMRTRRGRPIFFIDIAVPRDIESGVGDIDNVFVYNIDDLQAAVQADVTGRKTEVAGVESIVHEEVEKFMQWFRTLDAVPIITAMREKLDETRARELDRLRARLSHLSDEDWEAIEATTRSIVNKICHTPMIRIKEYATSDEAATRLETVCEVFGLCPVDEESAKGVLNHRGTEDTE